MAEIRPVHDEFLGKGDCHLSDLRVCVKCPSNIALVKYWGKYEGQIPANPSLSYTLSRCRTFTDLHFSPGANFSVDFFLEGRKEEEFERKIEQYFGRIEKYLPWVLKGRFSIKSENSFPHSSGIASSASGFGALSMALMDLDEVFSGRQGAEFKQKKTSFLARLGSGSACRSVYDGLVLWGECPEVEGSSDLYAVRYPREAVHPIFKRVNDWILLIHEGKKEVSSSLGHQLMHAHPYALRRFEQAREHFSLLGGILKSGDFVSFGELVEREALALHAMMMTSNPSFILMKPRSLECIERIRKFRLRTSLPLYFSMDAGANLHLLFPENDDQGQIEQFIKEELQSLSEGGGLIEDKVSFDG